MKTPSTRRLLASIILTGCLAFPAVAQERQKASPQSDLGKKIDKLIGQLGSTQYAARSRAQSRLAQLGLSAFDALHQAQHHDDIEIAMRARYLIRSMQINWAQDGDSSEVRRILKGYGRSSAGERRNRMERLTQLDEFNGLTALCRLVRYESNNRLAKHAALLVMNTQGLNDEHKPKLVQIIKESMGNSRRSSSRWALAFAQTLTDPEKSLATWAKISREEQLTLSQFPAQSSRHLLRDLFRWRAKMLQELNRKEEYLAVARQTMELLDGTEAELSEMVDWLIERKAWELVNVLATSFAGEFGRNAALMYRLAEAHTKRGDEDAAKKAAQEALTANGDDTQAHLEIAYKLRDRGLMRWSINEFQWVIKNTKPASSYNIYSRLLVSEILHDFDRDKEAADALKGVVDVMDRPEVARQIVQQWRRNLDGIRSRMNYFYALHTSRTDSKAARKHLINGLAKDPHDPDILIAMFRFPKADKVWKKDTDQKIRDAIKYFREQKKSHRTAINEATSPSTIASRKLQLAHANNQLAWLVGNTLGDIDEAISSSHESLKLRPKTSAYFDTLGRCYYRKGDYANAVKYQKEAVKLEPSSAQIRRQLQLFEKSLSEKKKSG